MTLQMSDYGIKIAKSGKSILSQDPEDYIFNTKYPTLSVKEMGSVSLECEVTGSMDPIPAKEVIEHNFGYKPLFIAFTNSYASQILGKYVFEVMDYVNLDFSVDYVYIGGFIHESVRGYVTDTELVFDATAYSWSPYFTGQIGLEWTYDIDYMLFMEEAV